MAGTLLAGQLRRTSPDGGVEVTLATPADDAGLRRLWRETPMAGRVTVSLEREPDYFAEEKAGVWLEAPFRQTVVARAGGRVVGSGSCTFHHGFVNGRSRRVGYLSGLRLDAAFAGRFPIARRGYQLLEELQRADPADCYFTTIAADNERSIRLLERGLPGLPKYHYLGDFITALVPVRGSQRARVSGARLSAAAAAEVSEVLKTGNCEYQLAPCWSADQLVALPTLGLGEFATVREAGKLVGCAALWDQRSYKQTVIRAYVPALALARPLINAVSRMTNRPGLPAINRPLAQALVSHLAVPADRPELLKRLLGDLLATAARKGIEFLTIGFADRDPRLRIVRGCFAAREYRTRIYRVQWPDLPGIELDQRIPFLEVALL
jgi:hypothetical protein